MHEPIENILEKSPEACAGCPNVIVCEKLRHEYRQLCEYINREARFSIEPPPELRQFAVETAAKIYLDRIIQIKSIWN